MNKKNLYIFFLKKEKLNHNRRILINILNQKINDERYDNFSKLKYFFFIFLFYIFGTIFVLKIIEKKNSRKLIEKFEDIKTKYLSSIVLGLSDSLIEITGVLCGLTISFSQTNVIGIVGLIVGVSASLSMGASEFLASLEEKNKNSYISCFYTGMSYFMSVIFLVFPFFIFENKFIALMVSLIIAFLIIVFYNVFTSIIEDKSFKKSFLRMFLILLIVSIISFLISKTIKTFFQIDL